MATNLSGRWQQAGAPKATWKTKNPVLLSNEIGIESDTRKFKFGDGVTHWNDLPYAGTTNEDVQSLIDAAEDNVTIVEATSDQTEEAALATVADSSKGSMAIIRRTISGDKKSYTSYVSDGVNWRAMDGNYSATNVYFPDDMMITKEVGYITLTNGQGTIPSAGKNLKEVFESIWVKEQNPTTTQPSVNLNFANAKSYEVGTTVTVSYSATFNAGSYSYGPATGVTVSSWEISDTAGHTATDASGSFASVVVADNTNYKITAKANHTAGATPVTNKGNAYAAGKISAGSKSKTSGAITGYRSFFYGVLSTSTTESPLTSALIRGLTNGQAYTGSKTFTINANASAKRIVVAIPSSSTRNGLSSVILTSAMNTPVTDSYVKTAKAVKVEGVAGAEAVDYDVWVYEPASIDAGEVHSVTLA